MLDQSSLSAPAVTAWPTAADAATDCAAPAWPTADEVALAELQRKWSSAYDVGRADGAYHAYRLTGGPVITASTLEGLDSAIRADFARGSGL
jgi:hypothetical protein